MESRSETVAPGRTPVADPAIVAALCAVDFTRVERVVHLGVLPTQQDRLVWLLARAFSVSALVALGNPGGNIVLERLRRFVLTGRGADA